MKSGGAVNDTAISVSDLGKSAIKSAAAESKLDQISKQPEASFDTDYDISCNLKCPTWLGVSRDISQGFSQGDYISILGLADKETHSFGEHNYYTSPHMTHGESCFSNAKQMDDLS